MLASLVPCHPSHCSATGTPGFVAIPPPSPARARGRTAGWGSEHVGTGGESRGQQRGDRKPLPRQPRALLKTAAAGTGTWPGALTGGQRSPAQPGPVPGCCSPRTARLRTGRGRTNIATSSQPLRPSNIATVRHRLHLNEPRGPPPAARPGAADRRTRLWGRGLAALAINIHESAAAGAPLPGPESEKLAEALPRSTRGSGGAIAAEAPGSRRGTQRRARTGGPRRAVRSGGQQKEPLRPRRCPPARGGGSPAPPGPRDSSAFFTAPPGG